MFIFILIALDFVHGIAGMHNIQIQKRKDKRVAIDEACLSNLEEKDAVLDWSQTIFF
jgi:hypothetical protein